ncbi:MAG: YceI family protein [Bacteroidia bacterium]|nr:YceI family protein [Bacteroidia bacterium]
MANRNLSSALYRIFLASVFFLLMASSAPQPTSEYDAAEVEITHASQLFLKGKTNINHFSCYSTESYPRLKVAYEVNETNRKVIFTPAVLRLTVDLMDCGQKEINRDMQEALNAETFPHIFIQLNSLTFTQDFASLKEGQWQNISAETFIKIAGVSRPARVSLKACKSGQNGLIITGKQNLLMTDFNITPPTTLMGLIRVQDEIEIHFDLRMRINK